MDDGYKHGKGIVLSTESFSLDDTEVLKKVLELKFELKVKHTYFFFVIFFMKKR